MRADGRKKPFVEAHPCRQSDFIKTILLSDIYTFQ